MSHDSYDLEIQDDKALPCAGKLVFATREQAQAAATTNAYWYKGVKLKAYQCRYCGHWHLSSSSD